MIYKNEDGSIYKITINSTDSEETIKEAVEVLNYLIKKTKHLPEETIELPKPNRGEIITKAG